LVERVDTFSTIAISASGAGSSNTDRVGSCTLDAITAVNDGQLTYANAGALITGFYSGSQHFNSIELQIFFRT